MSVLYPSDLLFRMVRIGERATQITSQKVIRCPTKVFSGNSNEACSLFQPLTVRMIPSPSGTVLGGCMIGIWTLETGPSRSTSPTGRLIEKWRSGDLSPPISHHQFILDSFLRCPLDGWGYPATKLTTVTSTCLANKSWSIETVERCEGEYCEYSCFYS